MAHNRRPKAQAWVRAHIVLLEYRLEKAGKGCQGLTCSALIASRQARSSSTSSFKHVLPLEHTQQQAWAHPSVSWGKQQQRILQLPLPPRKAHGAGDGAPLAEGLQVGCTVCMCVCVCVHCVFVRMCDSVCVCACGHACP